MTKQNDTLTLLNLACIKYTGCSLPISDFGGNNWKYELALDEYVDEPNFNPPDHPKYAKWFPHPYFNPLHLHYPSYDFGARVLRSQIVDEIKFLKSDWHKSSHSTKSEFNPYGYKKVVVLVKFDYNSIPSKVNRLFLEDLPSAFYINEYPKFLNNSKSVIHHNRTRVLDEKIMKHKNKRYDIWTKKGDLRKHKDTAKIIYELYYLMISMSFTGYHLYFHEYHADWDDVLRQIRGGVWHIQPWRYRGKTYHEWVKPMLANEPKLTTDDFIQIYNPQAINKQEKINRALITNFPSSFHH